MAQPSCTTPRPPCARRALRRALWTVMLGAVVGSGLVVPSAGAEVAGVAEASSALTAARQQRVQAAAALDRATTELAAAEARLGELGRQDAAVAAELARARRQVREYAVAAYIDGGRTDVYLSTLPPDDAGALAWRTGLVAGSTVSQGRAVDRYRALRRAAEPARVEAATQLDRARDTEDRARSAFLQASSVERDAEAAAMAARAEAARVEAARRAAERTAAEQRAAAQRAAEQARARTTATTSTTTRPGVATRRVAAPTPAPAPSAGRGVGDASPGELALLARIRRCESGGNYAAVSASGRYRGAYQFSVATWQAMGGVGDPAAAPPAEQDQRALMLLRRQGPRAWPVCSR